jgi:hypothetical protein
MTCRLCEEDGVKYEVSVTYRGDSYPLGVFDVETLEWSRTLDDISSAKVTLPADCCGKLDQIDAWSHELHISRNGDEVWCGPIEVPVFCQSGVTIVAKDVLNWSSVRVIHNSHVSAAQGSVSIAKDLLLDAFGPDDPDVLQWLTTYGTGVVSDRNYPANSKLVYDALKDLAQGSLDFTTIGRRIVLMNAGASIGRLTLLTCDDFQGDLCTINDGTAAATKAVVTGSEASGVVGSFGGVDPYYGLVERLVNDDRITTNGTAASQARGIVNGNNPPPVQVQPPNGAGLAPSAPVCINDLVPGVTVPVAIDCTCKTAVQDLRLTQLNVTYAAGQGETVQPVFAAIGTDPSA